MITSPEIKPGVCPKCGDDSPLRCELARQGYFVECDKCDYQTVAHNTIEEAIVDWNAGAENERNADN